MGMVKCTNENAFTWADSFRGLRYVFKPNEPVIMPEDAARHIFGYGEEDKERALLRNGWYGDGPGGDGKPRTLEAALAKLARFRFAEVVATFTEVGQLPTAHLPEASEPASAIKMQGGKNQIQTRA